MLAGDAYISIDNSFCGQQVLDVARSPSAPLTTTGAGGASMPSLTANCAALQIRL